VKDYRKEIQTAVEFIREHGPFIPEIIIQLGSGQGAIAVSLERPQTFEFDDIPHFPRLGGTSHQGLLHMGRIGGRKVVILQGRAHYYEGFSCREITTPIRVLSLLGAKILIVVNAAGGLNPAYKPGDIMLIRDHINAMGVNPLRGPNVAQWGPRYPDMSAPYNAGLQEKAQLSAPKELILTRGIYAAVSGPSLETPAETRLLRLAGADAVGMSTVPEVIVARHGGVAVLGISVIANVNDPDNFQEIVEADILQKMNEVTPLLSQLIVKTISAL